MDTDTTYAHSMDVEGNWDGEAARSPRHPLNTYYMTGYRRDLATYRAQRRLVVSA